MIDESAASSSTATAVHLSCDLAAAAASQLPDIFQVCGFKSFSSLFNVTPEHNPQKTTPFLPF